MINRFLSLCAANYELLMQLLSEMGEQDSWTFFANDSHDPSVGDIRISVLRRHTYTTKICLSCRGLTGLQWLPSPCLTLHAYNDVGVTEVVAWNGQTIKQVCESASLAEEKFCVNRYLGECLHLCLQRATAPRISPRTLLSPSQD